MQGRQGEARRYSLAQVYRLPDFRQTSFRASRLARGDDLAERKKLLFDNADAIISLPGGLGTFDELYEAVAARQLGLNGRKPVCLVNTDGFFDATLAQLDRMFEDKLLRGPWQNVLGNAPTAAAAVEYIVTELAKTSTESE